MLSKEWINQVRSSRNVLFAAFAVIALVGVYRYTVLPHRTLLYASQAYASTATELASTSEAVAKDVTAKAAQLEQLQLESMQLRKGLFSPDQAEKFLSDVRNIAQSLQCSVYSLNFVPEKRTDKTEPSCSVISKKVKLNFTGRFANIVSFMNKLQDRPRQVHINSVNIRLANQQQGQLDCNMTISIYVIEDQEK